MAALLVMLGCGSDDDDALAGGPDATTTTTTTTSLTTTSTAPAPTTTATEPPPADDGVLVELTTSGGLDGRGIGDLTVTAAGEVRHTGRDAQVGQDTLAPGDLDALAGLLESTDFAALPPEPDGGAVCADGFVYTVRYRQWTVTADDCTIPGGLAPVLDRLRTLLARFD